MEEPVKCRTALTYPDGDYIDVWTTGDRVTDLGETTRWLNDNSVPVSDRQEVIDDACREYEVEYHRGVLSCPLDYTAMVRLALACDAIVKACAEVETNGGDRTAANTAE